jgi:ATP-dependent protease ClpP protease subunit
MSSALPAFLEFSPNPARGVYICGTIDQDLVDRLTPQILTLRAASSDAISVFVDSRGGRRP